MLIVIFGYLHAFYEGTMEATGNGQQVMDIANVRGVCEVLAVGDHVVARWRLKGDSSWKKSAGTIVLRDDSRTDVEWQIVGDWGMTSTIVTRLPSRRCEYHSVDVKAKGIIASQGTQQSPVASQKRTVQQHVSEFVWLAGEIQSRSQSRSAPEPEDPSPNFALYEDDVEEDVLLCDDDEEASYNDVAGVVDDEELTMLFMSSGQDNMEMPPAPVEEYCSESDEDPFDDDDLEVVERAESFAQECLNAEDMSDDECEEDCDVADVECSNDQQCVEEPGKVVMFSGLRCAGGCDLKCLQRFDLNNRWYADCGGLMHLK